MDPALVELIERTAAETRRQMEAGFGLLRGEMSAMRGELRGEIGEVKRHADVIAEDLRDEIRLVAEGLVATNERLDRRIDGLRSDMKEEFADVRAMIRVSYRDLDQRVTRLESGAG